MADLLFFPDLPLGVKTGTETVYEGPSGYEIAFYRDAMGWNLNKARKRLKKRLGDTKFDDIFVNLEDRRKALDLLGTPIEFEDSTE